MKTSKIWPNLTDEQVQMMRDKISKDYSPLPRETTDRILEHLYEFFQHGIEEGESRCAEILDMMFKGKSEVV